MAELTSKTRGALPDSAFALPGRRYPIHDASHARNALARVGADGTPAEKSKVRAAVRKRFPEIDSAPHEAMSPEEWRDARMMQMKELPK